MKKSLRRITAGALFALAVLPGAADAAVSGSLAQSTVNAGCEPKGVVAFPAPKTGGTPGFAANATPVLYTVVAVTAGGPSTPCSSAPVVFSGPPAGDSAFIQWNATPGAVGYRIYRDGRALDFNPATPAIDETGPAAALCPAAAPNNGQRCRYQDNGFPAAAGQTALTFPATQTQAGSHPDLRIVQTIDYGDTNGGTNDASDDPYQGDPADTTDVAALKDNVLHFPPGLLANPTATSATCKLSGPAPSLLGDINKHGSSDPDEDTCPRASQVGTVSVVAKVGPNPGRTTIVPGDIYIGEKLSATDDATARLYVVLRPPCSAGSFIAPSSPSCVGSGVPAGHEVEKSFLSAKATIRGNDYGIDNETTSIADGTDKDLAATSNIRNSATGTKAGESRLQVQRLTQILFGFADQGTATKDDDKPFIYLPTSCASKTLSADITTYQDAPNSATLVSNPLQATGCDALDFSPTLSARVEASGQTGQNAHPTFIADIFQSAEEAATRTASVTLPEGLGTDPNQLGRACTIAQQATACPESSIVGSASATTPVLPGTLSGPVFLAESGPGQLPKLIVLLRGAATIKFEGAISFDSTNTRLVNTFDNLPEVTLSSFSLTINGGSNGLLQATRNLCNGGLGNINSTFTGHNGESVNQNPPVTGLDYYCVPVVDPPAYQCKASKPKQAIKIVRVGNRRPLIKSVLKRTGKCKKSNLRVTKLKLAKGLKFTKKAKKKIIVRANGKKIKSFKAKGRKLRIKTKGTTAVIRIVTKSKAIRASKKVAAKGKKQKLVFRTKVKVVGGKTYTIKKVVKPRS